MKEHDPSKYNIDVPRSSFPVGIDLDATLCENEWPREGIGRPLKGAVEAVHELQEHKRVVIFTSRPSYMESGIWRWCFDNGIRPFNIITGKPSFHFYIGDEAVPFNGDWNKVVEDARKRFLK